MGICAKDIMTIDVIYAVEDMTVQELSQLLSEHRITGAPVLDAAGALVGVVSASDILLHDEVFGDEPVQGSDYHRQIEERGDALWEGLAPEEVGDRRVGDIMSRGAITAQQDTPIAELAGLMYSHRIHRVIILNGDRLAGIVSTMDILKAVMEKRIS